RRSRPNRARWSMSPPTSCTPGRPRPRPRWCPSKARMRPTAGTASRRREDRRQQTVRQGEMTERQFARGATRSRGRLPGSVSGAWATIDAKLTPVGRRFQRIHREDAMKRVGLGLTLLCLVFGGVTASAQDKYPSRPVKVVVPYAPGGATDITARLFGEQMRQSLGQQFVVESKPGAFGILAIEEMARSKPDGYTLMVGNVTTNAITPVLFAKKFSINFEKDVVSVSRLAIYPSFLLTTTHNFEPKSVAELIA